MEALEQATAEDVVTIDTEEYGEVVLRAELDSTWSGVGWSPVINPPPPPSEETKKANAAIYMATKRYGMMVGHCCCETHLFPLLYRWMKPMLKDDDRNNKACCWR